MTSTSHLAATTELTDDELIERAAGLRELLRAEAKAGDEQRAITDTAFTAMQEAGLLRLGVPKRWGGNPCSWRTTLQVLVELGRGDLSASWIAFVLNVGAISGSLLSDDVQHEIWGNDPDATISGVYTPAGAGRRVDGGYRLSGKWPFNSGILRGAWTQVSFPVLADDGSWAEVGVALIPRADLTIADTWHVAGVRGSGSNTAVAEDIFVPENHVIPVEDLIVGVPKSEHPDTQRLARPILSPDVLMMLGPMLGAGQAALDFARIAIEKERPNLSLSNYKRGSEAPSYQLAYASAASKVDTALLHGMRAADDVDQSIARGVPLDEVTRGRIRMDMYVGFESIREAIALALTVSGASTFADGNPLNRVWRDFETASRHASGNPLIGHESYARALLGLEPIAQV